MKLLRYALFSMTLFCLSGAAVIADIGFDAYSFENLLKKSDCVVAGKVTEIVVTPDAYTMTLRVEEHLLGSVTGEITVTSAMISGLQKEDVPYLAKDRGYILFLQSVRGDYAVTNGIGGVTNINALNDVRDVSDAYSANRELFAKKNMSAMQSLFSSMKNEMAQRRLLESMKEKYTDADESFLSQLLESGAPRFQRYAAIQAGYAGIAPLRTEIESICAITDNTSLEAGCIFALAQYGDVRSLSVVLSALESQEYSVRANAVLAAGIIGSDEIIDPLTRLYNAETDLSQKIGIIGALSRATNKSRSRIAISELKLRETNERAEKFMERTINKLE